MIKITKTPLPEDITITKEEDYRSDPVFSIIEKDFYNKCYICEDKAPTKINVEHRIAHQGDKKLKYDWNNLFFSCAHCNSGKSTKYNEIIDCTQVDPEQYIALSMLPFPKENVIIEKKSEIDGIDQTIELLNRVYNGAHTKMYKLECENLKDKIFKELCVFQTKIISYFDEPDPELKNEYKRSISRMIHISAAFSSFKRKIINDNTTYVEEFGQ